MLAPASAGPPPSEDRSRSPAGMPPALLRNRPAPYADRPLPAPTHDLILYRPIRTDTRQVAASRVRRTQARGRAAAGSSPATTPRQAAPLRTARAPGAGIAGTGLRYA